MLLVTGITGHNNSRLHIEKVVGDNNDNAFIASIMKDVRTVVHIYNIHHSPMIVQEAIKNKVERTILVHTTGIYSKFKYAAQDYKDLSFRKT